MTAQLQPAIRANSLFMHKIVHKINNTNGKHRSLLIILLLLFHFLQQIPIAFVCLVPAGLFCSQSLEFCIDKSSFPQKILVSQLKLTALWIVLSVDFLVLGVELIGLQIKFSSQDILNSILSHAWRLSALEICFEISVTVAVLRIRIHVFLGLLDPDPDPLVRGMDPDPSIIKQK